MKKLSKLLFILAIFVSACLYSFAMDYDGTQEFRDKGIKLINKSDSLLLHQANLRCVPSPSKEHLELEYTIEETSNVELQLYNSYGRQINKYSYLSRNPGTHMEYIEISRIRKGIYIAHISIGKLRVIKKFVKF